MGCRLHLQMLSSLVVVACTFAQAPQPQESPLNAGVQAYKAGDYKAAIQAFERAVALDPNSTTAHLYLGTAFMSQYIPGADTPENVRTGERAESEFQTVLRLDPRNIVALQSLASLAYNQAQGIRSLDEKMRTLDLAADRYRALAEVDPQNKEAHYSIGVVGWGKFYPALMQARAKLGMQPEMPGPLPDPGARADLLGRYGAIIDEAMQHLNRALDIDPAYDDAMAYMNLLVRERADLVDSEDEYKRQVAIADAWVQKALDTKRAKAGQVRPADAVATPPGMDRAIRVGGGVQADKLITQVPPVYPPLALQARLQGTVRFTATIAADGHVRHLQLVSGHPLLVESAKEAVQKWVYRPTLLNGQPVEVITTVQLIFKLPEPAR